MKLYKYNSAALLTARVATRWLLYSAAVAVLVPLANHASARDEKVEKTQFVQTSKNRRITVLGVTRGVAFLETPNAVADGDRDAGSHPVEWLQIKLFVEMLVGEKTDGTYKIEIQTPEGKPFAKSFALTTGATNHASSLIESGFGDPRLPMLLYPVKAPKIDVESRGYFLILGESGALHSGKKAQLKMSISRPGNDKPEEFLFTLPTP